MGLLAVAYLMVDVMADDGASMPLWVIVAFTTVFVAEFTLRFVNARSRVHYLRHHWLDLVSSMPLVGGLRSVRLLRLLRLVRAARAMGAIDRAAAQHGRSGGSLSILLPALAVVWFGAALAYWTLEHNINPDARTFGDALFWAFLTMTTVGYGTTASLHGDTRVLAGLVIFVGIGLVSVVSGHVVSRLLHNEDTREAELQRQLAAIQTELRLLRAHLESLRIPGD